MNTKSFSEVANKVMAREVDTDENVNLVYELKEAPKTSRITILAAVFPSMTNKGGNKLKIYYDDIF